MPERTLTSLKIQTLHCLHFFFFWRTDVASLHSLHMYTHRPNRTFFCIFACSRVSRLRVLVSLRTNNALFPVIFFPTNKKSDIVCVFSVLQTASLWINKSPTSNMEARNITELLRLTLDPNQRLTAEEQLVQVKQHTMCFLSRTICVFSSLLCVSHMACGCHLFPIKYHGISWKSIEIRILFNI